ncbi:ribonuclease Z [Lewinella marina]|uniref:Ribonuclease Z n=1 Tax=Neolewinella marina TaxID=438751 RepID=A0A2G0CI70_9BACT|nr:ribonuclease Z [Neolewinella marina]NJB85194.1 ribonuclease Z [Neolewinella marina]PHK99673.1 ribonuclease [Neolewinella marina]
MRFAVTILGSNGAVPTADRHASAHLLESEAADILIDCGEGTQLQLQSAGAGVGRIGLILITHLHGDHYFGLPGLLTTLALTGRTAPLRIISPPGLRAKLTHLLDLDRYALPFGLEFVEHAASARSVVAEMADLEVLAFPLRHRIPTNGYLIREKSRPDTILKDQLERFAIPVEAIPDIKAGGDFISAEGQRIPHAELTAPAPAPRSYAYCSDTAYFPELSAYVRGVDLLYHEATFLHDLAAEAAEKGHSTAHQAALVARDASAGHLILGHFSARYRDVEQHEREAREVFARTTAARDLYRFVIPYSGRRGN